MADDAAKSEEESELRKVLQNATEQHPFGADKIITVRMRAALALARLDGSISQGDFRSLCNLINGQAAPDAD